MQKMNINRYFKKGRIKICAALLVVLFISSGCDFISGLQKEAKEEKDILGYVGAYNPRIREIQETLKEMGFPSAANSGIMDKQTRKAIKGFQKICNIKQTGFIDKKTKAQLDKVAIEAKTKKAVQVKEVEKQKVESQKIKKAQLALKKAGFNPGPANGAMNEKTKKALVAFQKAKGLDANGKLNSSTWEALSKYFEK